MIEIAVYAALLAALYFYTNKQGSIGFFWICCYVLFQWLINEKLGVDNIIASSVTGGSLLLTFEISRCLWEEPFSLANVVQGVYWLIAKLGRLIAVLGFAPKTALLDFKKSDHVLKIKKYLAESDWDTAETYLKSLPANERYGVIQSLVEVKGNPKEFDAWLGERPESVMAHIVSGYHLIHWAWEARGGGVSDTVTSSGYEKFFVRLLKAKETLETAIVIENNYADPYVGLITIAMGTGFEREKVWEYFAKALVHTKDHYEAHVSMINALAEKWGGEEEEMFSVARKPLANAAKDSPLAGIIAVAHIEKWLYLGMCDLDAEAERYFRQSYVRNELQDAYKRMEDCSLETSGCIEALNAFAYCFYSSGLASLSKEVIIRLNGNFVEYPWDYCSESAMSMFDTAYAIDQVIENLGKVTDDLPEIPS